MKAYNKAMKEKYKPFWSRPDISPWENKELKYCSGCKRDKNRKEFSLSRVEKDGLQGWCDPCRWSRYEKDPRSQMLTSAKRRAQAKGIEFSLTKENIKIPDVCPVLGIKLYVETNKGQHPGSPSLDRLDNTKGYTPDNIHVISWRANDLKRDATAKELRAIADYIEKG